MEDQNAWMENLVALTALSEIFSAYVALDDR